MADDRDYVLATCSYSAFRAEMGVPVRTSVGIPYRWPASNPPLEFASKLAPYGLLDKKMPSDEFTARYLARLDKLEHQVVNQLMSIARAHPGEPLVLLCYENLADPNTPCHRSLVRLWLEDHTGAVVPELSAYDHCHDAMPEHRPLPAQGRLL